MSAFHPKERFGLPASCVAPPGRSGLGILDQLPEIADLATPIPGGHGRSDAERLRNADEVVRHHMRAAAWA